MSKREPDWETKWQQTQSDIAETKRSYSKAHRETCLNQLRSSASCTDQAIAQLMEDVEALQNQQTEFLHALIGNEKFNQLGLVQKVTLHAKRIAVIERVMLYGSGALVTMGLFFDEIKKAIFKP